MLLGGWGFNAERSFILEDVPYGYKMTGFSNHADLRSRAAKRRARGLKSHTRFARPSASQRAPAFPTNLETRSSACACTMTTRPTMECRPLRLMSWLTTLRVTLPEPSDSTFPRSPTCCFWASGALCGTFPRLKRPLAEVASATLQSPFSWTWKPCLSGVSLWISATTWSPSATYLPNTTKLDSGS